MNLTHRFKFKKIAGVSAILVLLLSFSFSNTATAASGEDLFKTCAACHKIEGKLVGPGLKGVREKWKKAGVGDRIYDWVQNPQKLKDEGVPYVTELVSQYSTVPIMTPQSFSKDEIDAIFDYVDNYKDVDITPPVDPTAPPKEEGGSWMWIIILGTIFTIIAISAGSVRRQLVNANRETEGKEELPDSTYWTIWKAWAWRNKVLVSFVIMFFIFGGLADGWYRLKDVGVFENYKPEQPIAFSHKVHAGDDKIACQYCHSDVEKSRHATIPSPMLCMNCHKGIQKGTTTGVEEIAKIYQAVGFDPTAVTFSGKTKPIEWVKVHNLPDHVYFSHQQHTVAGKLDCKQCHGDMTKETVARVMPVAELNAIEGNVKVNRPTLTMGWCIECHNNTEVKMDGNGYYDEMKKRLMLNQDLFKQHLADGKITVAEMGGWECAKCHY